MWPFARDVAVPLGLIALIAIWPIANFKFGGTLWMLHGVALLALRLLLVAVAGFLVTYRTPRSLWAAGAAGVIMFFVEQVAVNAVFFMVSGQYRSAVAAVESFAVLVWVPCLIGMLGGLAGKLFRKARPEAQE